jgi:hypothetical protein
MKIRFASLVAALGLVALGATEARASSHREAPFVTKNPKVDATDFYMFRSYETSRVADGYVTLIANYIPVQAAYGGPNFYTMDPEALYEIHVDNTGDGVEDITFQFRFTNTLAGPAGGGLTLRIEPLDGGPEAGRDMPIPLIHYGAIAADASANLGVHETYSITVVRGNRRTGTPSAVPGGPFKKPVDFIGGKTFGGAIPYASYARAHIYNFQIPGCAVTTTTKPAKVFVGQRQEGFAVALGPVFDLVNVPSLGFITNPANRGVTPNPLASANVTSIALEVPRECLTSTTGGDVIAGWTTASVRQARVINPQATYALPAREGGAWTQVSRLGHPLVNEVVIGLRDKDRFNSSEPKDDGASFGPYLGYPTLPKILEIVFGAANAPAPTQIPRPDLGRVYLTGITGVNEFSAGASAETLKLNTAVAPKAAGAQNNLGALECVVRPATPSSAFTLDANRDAGALGVCDTAGFPNGRRPGDDVVDISLRVMMGRLLAPSVAPAGDAELHDTVLQDASQFDQEFPYLKTPNPGS